MAIPQKPKESLYERVINERMETLSKTKFVRIRDLPKGKLFKWTMFFFLSSMSVFMAFGGPLDLFKRERRLRDARALEELGGVKIGKHIGYAKPFTSDYGYDFTNKVKDVTELEDKKVPPTQM